MKQIKDEMTPFLEKDEIQEIVYRLAKEIEMDYVGKEVILICPLKGSVPFAADFMRQLNIPQRVDFVNLNTITNEEGESVTTIVKDITTQITGKHVLIVEEIIDAGRKLTFLKNRLLASGPASLKVVTLLDKPARRVINIKADYIGKTIEDRFVVGYGMDDDGLGRNYEGIYILRN